MSFYRCQGVVSSFDDPRGVGTVRDGEGREWFFHCTAIADGTRSIADGTEVTFDVVPGRRGQWEAAAIRLPELSPAGRP